MVSQDRAGPPSSRERLIAAATEEFSARGFDGAKVDRIAARARVNKAMLYYHFRSKAALYREILRTLFDDLAHAVDCDATRTGPPADRLRAFVRIIAVETADRPLFPSIWLREMGEHGRHLDARTLRPIGAIVGALDAILKDGAADGVFRPVHPVVVQMAIVAPLLLFTASAPMRERHGQFVPGGAADVGRDALASHLEAATLAAIDVTRAVPAPRVATRRERR